MLKERSGDSAIRAEAERIIEALASNVQNATFYAGVSRLYLPEENVIMVARTLDDPKTYALADQKNGYYTVEVNFPTLSEEIIGTRFEVKDLSRVKVRNFLRVFLRNNVFRSYLVHELTHVMLRKKSVSYTLKSDEWSDYANNPEEVSAWLNQAIYDLVYKARGSKLDPRRTIGYDASEFMEKVAYYLFEKGLWESYTEETKRRVMKRAYTGYEEVLKQVTSY
jgi:hypothetical protein